MKKNHLFGILLIPTLLSLIFISGVPVSAQQSASSEADSVRDKIKQKVEEAKKNPKAFIGVITDKTESNIQMRLDSGEIGQISVDYLTTYVKADKKTKINFSEVGIGDYIVAMGYKNANGIIQAKRVLLYPQSPANTKRLILYSKVTEVNASQLNVKDKNGTVFYIKPATDIVVTIDANNLAKKIKFSNIQKNDTVVAIGEINNSLIEARRIYVYPAILPSISPNPTAKTKTSPTPTTKPKFTTTPSPTPKP